MKNYIINQDCNTITPENYNEILDSDMNEIIEKYKSLLVNYLSNIRTNLTTTNKKHILFFIIRGLETMTSVFIHMLCYTKNINLVYTYGEKAIYFYTEFICQITDAGKLFLKLTSRDSTIYVYKKTIYNLRSDYTKRNEIDDIKLQTITETLLDILKITTILLTNKDVEKQNDIINDIKNDIINKTINDIQKYIPLDI